MRTPLPKETIYANAYMGMCIAFSIILLALVHLGGVGPSAVPLLCLKFALVVAMLSFTAYLLIKRRTLGETAVLTFSLCFVGNIFAFGGLIGSSLS